MDEKHRLKNKRVENLQLLMLEATVGNEYSTLLSNALAASGVKVMLVVPKERKFTMKPGCEVLYLMPPKGGSVNKIFKLFSYPGYLLKIIFHSLLNRDVILHFQFFRNQIDSFLFIVLRLLGVRTVKTAHNILPHEKKRIDYILHKIVYKYSSAIIVHSELLKTKLLTMFDRIDPAKIKVVPHGDFNFYRFESTENRETIRSSFGFGKDDKVLLFFGIIREYKGLDILLDAFGIARNSDSRLKLLIAGDPFTEKLKNFYIERIKALNNNRSIISHLEFIPAEKVSDYFTSADIVILPYKHIDHSGIIHLAYSFGKPVIATRVGDFTEVIEHGKSGFLLDSNDAENLAKWISIAFSDSDQLNKMGEYASHLNETKYSWQTAALKTIEIYREINE
jgi:glycosyltransferase involved in cell wall biosynthesis